MPRLRIVCSVACSVACFVALGLAAGAYGALAQDAVQSLPRVMQGPVDKSRDAIAECRDRRLQKELSSYKESAECSNPKIFAAWQAAHYPHMDLITVWLNAREAASEKVDQHLLTPQQFEQEMDTLTVRLTAEEERRRTGQLSAPDSDMKLQLPAATEVVGVATPPGEEKLTAKKSAAARERAAVIGPPAGSAGPSSRASVGAMGSLAGLDANSANGGVGGPLVPVPANSPAARAALARAQAAAAPGPGSSGLYAHLASQRSEAEARTAYRSLQGQYPTLLASRDAVIRRADDTNQGTFYRVEVGPLTSSEAGQLCGSIKSAGGQCVPRYE